ncbi:alpha/beta-Hydrolases superfamily protein [Prunus dulcis]|uniref:Alpha/beta-Hydrolases superfamily protein n=1 Tax=Prunus dulcis TaxID=3755 RepID=A0A4Y1RXK3_PRUDU|nr:alpha/beta-Hydrolases superfamily protein [Prunus dulcis]
MVICALYDCCSRSLVCAILFGGPNMSFTSSSVGSGGRTVRRVFEFGRTYVVRPKGKHQATVVWLHGLGDNGSRGLHNNRETEELVPALGDPPSSKWFDVGELSEDAPDDIEGLDASAAHVANLLSTEPDDSRTLSKKLEEVDDARRRAASLPLLLCHGKGDDVVPYKFGEKSSQALSSTGYQNVAFKAYNGLGHYTVPEEMDEVCAWLLSKLGLEGTSS